MRAPTVRLLAPIGLVLLAALVHEARLPILGILVIGLLATRGDALARWAWAAPIPVAVSLAWGLLPAPIGASDGADCASLGSPPAIWRLGEATVALAALGLLAWRLGAQPADLGLRRPTRLVAACSIVGAILVGPVAVAVGPALARPFFGSFELATGDPTAILPALVFALSNGTMEELVYRGSMQGWLTRAVGPGIAIAAQALTFGLAHSGPDFVGSPVPVMLAMTTGGLIAGLIVRRTGSLAFPLALHVAFDIPLYYYWACRVG